MLCRKKTYFDNIHNASLLNGSTLRPPSNVYTHTYMSHIHMLFMVPCTIPECLLEIYIFVKESWHLTIAQRTLYIYYIYMWNISSKRARTRKVRAVHIQVGEGNFVNGFLIYPWQCTGFEVSNGFHMSRKLHMCVCVCVATAIRSVWIYRNLYECKNSKGLRV